ncbi:MAG: hypothetical protein LC749_22095, partial [Actinobacteria bacterium]|nr:hypothetical protein [Actinomycetota bacterium]
MSVLSDQSSAALAHNGTAPIRLVEGTELIGEFRSSGYREPSQLVCRSDGRIIRLAPALYGVVSAIGRYSPAASASTAELLSRIADDVGRETGLGLTGDHIAYLIDTKLAPM